MSEACVWGVARPSVTQGRLLGGRRPCVYYVSFNAGGSAQVAQRRVPANHRVVHGLLRFTRLLPYGACTMRRLPSFQPRNIATW